MRYQISHTTTYIYSQSVILQPHVVRLRPRCDCIQALQSFSLLVSPIPTQQAPIVDLDGNDLVKLWFPPDPIDTLQVQVLSQVETFRDNPFCYLLEPWAVQLPIDYPTSLLTQLRPYLVGQYPYDAANLDPIAVQLAQSIHHKVDGNTTNFLVMLCQEIYQTCQYTVRETGDPLPPGITWSQRMGSCRDLTVLFIEVCRAIGLAARFVSGYQEGDANTEENHLHAWAEVYLPGAGWRGYDPTQGLAVSDRHVALVSSAVAQYAAPISGAFKQTGSTHAQSSMTYQLMVQTLL